MNLLDQWAESHIAEAMRNGEFDKLQGQGQRLVLDDDSHVPSELRAGYRLLKNAGYLPPELEQRREAVQLNELLNSIEPCHPDRIALSKKLALLELKLQQAGVSTDFLRSDYGQHVIDRVEGN
ncbi:DnaJ family domain-containing protein [Siccibacter colletis]|uniref:DUF1992 domain-containing protein n=1 Tax=Siccibacter colletis TaxID=1505757 RepID=A0ABY6JEY6_9ENTR|nr:DnaJ family domain-containing protein [Siccibacter colletis]UYU32284.1 DUF1992 domain-containing protein [Siccibacter colletis]